MLIAFVVLAVLLNPVECIFNKVKPSLCFEEMDAGKCLKRFRKYYYDSGTAECKPFYYGGCGGNKNNFESLAACQKMCRNVCTLPKKVGPCKSKHPRYFFNTMLGKCTFFYFGGCEPNANTFLTLNACRRECPDVNPICLEESYVGNARNADVVVKYAFNTVTWRCKAFVYSGKGGNNNNFASNAECEKTCPLRDLCRFPPDHGPCQGDHDRWHYDIISRQCQLFKYGGCLGNDNNFVTKEDCESRCPERDEPKKPEAGKREERVSVCNLPKAGEVEQSQKNDVASQNRFYYDSKSNSCKFFEYAGFGGNRNNFQSVEECNLNCPIRSPCVESLDRGSGSGRLQQWYYNLASGLCVSFVYTGRGGNRNRFIFKSLCQEKCIGCAEKQERGPCLGFQTRYSYNGTSGECERFIYGGCKGSRNRFHSPEECRRRCQ